LFQPLADHRLAAGFGNARTDKQTLATKLCVAHPFRVGLKVVDGFADFFLGLVFSGSYALQGADHSHFDEQPSRRKE
jgi:hypothetical protein